MSLWKLGSYCQVYQRSTLCILEKGTYCATGSIYPGYSYSLLSLLHSTLWTCVSPHPECVNFSLKPIDIVVLKKLSDVVNVVPVIAKSDSLTLAERQAYKQRVIAHIVSTD